jgi:hypothetical protein
MIEDMEAGKFSRLPGGNFIRGFLAAYAREVELDPVAVVAEYVAAQQPPVPVAPAAPAPPPRLTRLRLRQVRPIAAAIAVALAIVILAMVWPRDSSSSPDGLGVATSGQDRAGLTPLDDEALASPASAVTMLGEPEGGAVAAERLHVELRARAPVWIEITSDGHAFGPRLLNAGAAETHSAREQIQLRVGDAAALAYSINGAEGRTLGAASEVREVVFTPENYKSFLVRPPAPATSTP